jgi:hypothetical protein
VCACVCVRERESVDVCLRECSACMRLHVDTRLRLLIQARVSACACVHAYMCLYASACMRFPVLLERACVFVAVCMSYGRRGS